MADDPNGPHLCPLLVVPEDKECKLLVPLVRPSYGGASITISDTHGRPIFKAAFGAASSGRGAPGDRRVALLHPVLDTAFACCRDAEADRDGGPAGLAILDDSENTFGVLRADSPQGAGGYSLAACGGWWLRFRGEPDGLTLSAIDKQGRLLAMTEVNGPRQIVHIGPLVDAGLITLAVLGIHLLEDKAPSLQ